MTWVGAPLNRIVMWGGSGSDYLNDIVALDPATGAWTTIDPDNNCVGNTAFEPNGSDENGLVWDPSGRLWLYNGGSGYRCGTPQRIGRTAAAGTTTTSIVDPTLSASINYKDWQVRAPDNGYAYVTSYNAATRTLTLATPVNVVAGGAYDLFVDFGGGTWSYNFGTGTYSKLQQVHWGYGGYVPAPRRSPGFASDGADAFLFGGLDYDNGLYRLNYATGAYTVAIAQGAASSPPARGEITGHFVYDSLHDRFVLFGGRCYDPSRCSYGSDLNDTWIYDPNANRWTQATPIVRPPARDQGHMYFDSKLGVVVLYGGIGSTVFNDVWTFDVTTLAWTQQAMPAVNPGGVYLGQVAYAPTTQCGYIVYGLTAGPVADGTWKLCLSGSNMPPVAKFSANPSPGTAGSPVAFSAAASFDPDGTIKSYAWNFGDGTNGSGASTSKTYGAAGTYTVSLTVTDNGGLTGSTTGTITIDPAGGSTAVWVDDNWPAGAVVNGAQDFAWTTTNPVPYSGARAHQSVIAAGLHQHYFTNATATLSLGAGDKLFTYVYLDPANPPKEVMLQFNDGTWEHRAYWGADLIAWGTPGTASRFYAGPLPAAGQWVRLEVSASQLGLAGRTLNGMAFTLYDGRATWDLSGKTTSSTTAWVEDDWPAGAVVSGAQDFAWTTTNPVPYSGARAHQSVIAAGLHQHYFTNATSTISLGAGDKLFTYVYLDPANPPKEVMLQFNDGSWEHRAYWGADLIAWGTPGTASRFYAGPLPAAGQWVRLEVSASQLGLAGRTLNGMAFTLYDGRATWDLSGKSSGGP